MTEFPLKNVSDTAFWIAHFRAVESARTDALFSDSLAQRLAGSRGQEIAAAMPMSRMMAWTVAIRTVIIDNYISHAIEQAVDTVLNLGAGLDTRPYRMRLPATLRWIESDYAHVIEYKEKQLATEHPRCRLERIKIDLADVSRRQHLFSTTNSQANKLLVLTEGVIPYLSIEQVAALADDLRSLNRARYWIVDYFSQQVMKYRRHAGWERKMQNSPFKFAPDDWFGFFEQHGWHCHKIHYLSDEAQRLGRPSPLPLLMRIAIKIGRVLIPGKTEDAFRKFAGYVLLEPH